MPSIIRYAQLTIRFLQLQSDSPNLITKWAVALIAMPIILALQLVLVCRTKLVGPLIVEGVVGPPSGKCVETMLAEETRRATNPRMHFRLPDAVQLYAYLFGVWEPDITHFVRRRLHEGQTFLDIGAHVGYYSVLAHTIVGDGRVVAVEASPSIFQQLQANLKLSGSTHVRALNLAATRTTGSVVIHQGPDWNLGWSTTDANSTLPGECEVPGVPVDQILTVAEVKSLRLIKIDVEGTERELFDGLLRLLAEAPADVEVLIEVSPRWWKTPPLEIEEALQPFVAAGFHIYQIANDYLPWRYLWPNHVSPPQRARQRIHSRIGQVDIILSRVDAESL